ncbi:hypothetical protein ABRZ00_12740 [Castellaniella ginsengisoli]|uniref:DUF3383 family protein n=1 Tax=Castellaniella ginsengisoli TaxID=546114 RepID=A0AB39DNJ7_9BURK
MSYPADRIIQVNARISPAGLGFANFGSITVFAAAADVTGALVKNTRKTYLDIQEVAEDFPDTTETYKAAAAWLGGTPKGREITIWMTDGDDTTIAETLNKARDAYWWYWTAFTAPVLAVPASVKTIAAWCEQNASMMINNQTGAAVMNHTGDRGGCLVKVKQVPQSALQVADSIALRPQRAECRRWIRAGVGG